MPSVLESNRSRDRRLTLLLHKPEQILQATLAITRTRVGGYPGIRNVVTVNVDILVVVATCDDFYR